MNALKSRSLPVAIVLLVAVVSAPAQNVWTGISLTEPGAKIITTAHAPRFSIGLTAACPLGSPAPQNIPFQDLQFAFQSPETAAQLFEQFGGPFSIGGFSGQSTATQATLNGRFQVHPGLFAGLRLSPHFSLRAGAERYRAEWSGKFPVLVLPFQQQHTEPVPQPRQGSLNASASGWMGEAAIQFSFPGRVLQPYVEGGVRGVFAGRSEASAALAGVKAPLNFRPIDRSFSPFAGAGLRVAFWKNGFVQSAFSLGKMAGGTIAGECAVGIGWHF